MKKKDIIANIIYILTFLIIYYILTKKGFIFGSTKDFMTQHYLIPEYFRKLFCETKDIFPDFAFNLGGGQNIYYFSYYGLLNPFVLISYLFPYIKMLDYLIFINCLIVIVSVSLFYFFLKSHNYNFKTRFIVGFLFLCSSPLIFHAHRHFMFISYMPFLITALFGTDLYLKENKINLLVISIVLMIFTSYYYSVSGLVVLFIYYLYQSFNKLDLKKSFKIILLYLVSIIISAIIIIPTLYTLLSGRDGDITKISLITLFKPSLKLLYSPYSIGLTLISLIALICSIFSQKKENRFLSIICILVSVFPIFNYILNGTLYINSKSLIPFIPLILILVAEFLNPYFDKKINFKQVLIILYLIISSFTVCLCVNLKDNLMIKNKDVDITSSLINEIIKNDSSIYRINNNALGLEGVNLVTNMREYKSSIYSSSYNSNYKKLYFDILNNPVSYRNKMMLTSSNDILTSILLGEKYIITKDNLPLNLVKEESGIKVYQNDSAMPLGYANSNILSYKDYKKLSYPDNAINLVKSVVVDDDSNTNLTKTKKINLDYSLIDYNNVEIKHKNNKVYIKAKNNATLKLKINDNMKDKVLFLRIHNFINPNYDTSITINGIKNKLSDKRWKYHNSNFIFDYVIYDNDILKIEFEKGNYVIDSVESYILDYKELINKDIDEFVIDYNKTKGDFIVGDINVKKKGYFVLSIPYDKGFSIKVDNKKTNYKKVNSGFIGLEIEKGNHHIEIEYKAPYKTISLIISLFGIILLIGLNIKNNKTMKFK